MPLITRQNFGISLLKKFFISYFIFFILEILRVSFISDSCYSLKIPYSWTHYVFVLFSVCHLVLARSIWFQLVLGGSSSFQIVPTCSSSFLVLVCTFLLPFSVESKSFSLFLTQVDKGFFDTPY